MRVAFSNTPRNTGSSSPGELLMTPEHLGGRGLLLERLAQLPPSRVKLVLKESDSCFLHGARLTRALRSR
jgi:hypothetical protein